MNRTNWYEIRGTSASMLEALELYKEARAPRDYKREYAQYHSKPQKVEERSQRNQARRIMGLEKGDPREVDHKNPISSGGSNARSNLRAISLVENRKKFTKTAASRAMKEARELLKMASYRPRVDSIIYKRENGKVKVLAAKDDTLSAQGIGFQSSPYSFPGGGVEPDQDPISAAQMEAMEEAGVMGKDFKLISNKPKRISLDQDWRDRQYKKRGERLKGVYNYSVIGEYDQDNNSILGRDNDAWNFSWYPAEDVVDSLKKDKGQFRAANKVNARALSSLLKTANDRERTYAEMRDAIRGFSAKQKIDPEKAMLVAGGAGYMHGMRDEVNDLDFFHDDLPDFVKAPHGRFEMDGGPGKDLPDAAKQYQMMHGMRVQTPEAMLAFYQRLNRPKDQDKIKMLQDHLKTASNQHYLVTGHSGAGKSTLSRKLSEETGAPIVSLDDVPSIRAILQEQKDMARAHPEGKLTLTPELNKKYEAVELKAIQDAIAAKNPSIIEGSYFLKHNPEMFRGNKMMLVDRDRDTILNQRVERQRLKELGRGGEWSDERAAGVRTRGNQLLDYYQPGVDTWRNSSLVEKRADQGLEKEGRITQNFFPDSFSSATKAYERLAEINRRAASRAPITRAIEKLPAKRAPLSAETEAFLKRYKPESYLLKSAATLYHGSPYEGLTSLQPREPRGNTDYERQNAVFTTDNPDAAALYALARDKERKNRGWSAIGGRLQLGPGANLNEKGYIYNVDTDNYLSPPKGEESRGFAIPREINVSGVKEVTPAEYEHLIDRFDTKDGFNDHIRSLINKTAAVATKTDPAKWEAAKQEAKSKMGGKHSARAMQLATKIYKDNGGGYSGAKPTSSTNSLKKWTKQDWGYSGKDKPGPGGTGVYLPKQRRVALKSSEEGKRLLANAAQKKREATRSGEQYSSHGLAAGTSLTKKASKLTAASRNQISEGNFALPGRRYPIHDITHARSALSMVAAHGTPTEKTTVRKAVHAKFPSIGEK